MDALGEFRAVHEVVNGPRCAYQLLDLSEADRHALDKALAHKGITAKAIEKWCAARGAKWVHFNINRHRRGDCRCPKS